MKVNCIDCLYLKENICLKNSKNGYFNCKKFKAIPMDTLNKEMHNLMISGENEERLKYLKEKISNFNGGTI